MYNQEILNDNFIGSLQDNQCEPADPRDTLTSRLNDLLHSNGHGYVLRLCPGTKYHTTSPLQFTAPNQEISTAGYPTGATRATIVVSGSTADDDSGHTTAVDGTCAECAGVVLRNVEIDGNRAGARSISGGANIEMGGPSAGQRVEYVHSHDPRGWSCLHITEGGLRCRNATVENNDIGPCGTDESGQWADGISMSCADSVVRGNLIDNPTDGGIVLFGAPGTRVENNTIWVEKYTLLGGINLVDYLPWKGNYTGTVVTGNFIFGGFATSKARPGQKSGTNANNALVKIGIAIGPHTWFGDRFGNNVNTGGTVTNNRFTGAFSYAIGMSSASKFRVQNNILVGNTSFIGTIGSACRNPVPQPGAFVIDRRDVRRSVIQAGFEDVEDGDNLICVAPPVGSDQWPFGRSPGGSGRPVRRSVATLFEPGLGEGCSGCVVLAMALVAALMLVLGRLVRRNHKMK